MPFELTIRIDNEDDLNFIRKTFCDLMLEWFKLAANASNFDSIKKAANASKTSNVKDK